MQEDDDNIIIAAKLLDNNLSSKWCKVANSQSCWVRGYLLQRAYNSYCLMRDLGIHDADKLKIYADIGQIMVIY